ncbi:MAG: glycosyl transferase [Sulfuriferula sp.]
MLSNSQTLPVEHFVTLFDNNFLPMGLCLYQSLLELDQPFHLWILCMDELAERHLHQLVLPHVSLISLREVEDDRLLAVKPTRSRGEYCWTLTPFTPQFVFDRDASVDRVTYLDADLYFFASPEPFFEEFDRSGKHVLITEHAYDPRYDKTRRSGRFCVQFMTFRRTQEAEKVMHWWQARCLEWCYARVEGGKFGDQKYLDQWPTLFGHEVHILQQKDKTLAPWNVHYYEHLGDGCVAPVFYHFHGLRLIAPGKLLLYSGYQVGNAACVLYDAYKHRLLTSINVLRKNDIPVPYLPLRDDFIGRLLQWKRRIFAGEGYATLPNLGSID